MLAVEPLMTEHRLIERMVALLGSELELIASAKNPNLVLVDAAVDFMRTYADRTHHGKEEEILFRALEGRKLSADHRKAMDELVSEHLFARAETKAIAESKERHLQGDIGALSEMTMHMERMIRFYPSHIRKEDEGFFIPAMAYFTAREQEAMLEEFGDFDRQMIHEKYEKVARRFEYERSLPGARAKLDWIKTL